MACQARGRKVRIIHRREREYPRAQVEEVDVSRFDCPTCLATRNIALTEGSMKFPWHPKRTTTTPNHGLRWVKREIWRPFDQ
jgi:hypothetical protein